MTLRPEVEARARRLTLENAVAHEGVARAAPIVARLLAVDPALRPHAEEVRSLVSALVAEAAGVPVPELEDRLTALGGPEPERPKEARSTTGEFPELPGAERGKVVLRMAPFPSGALHIGNGRMLFVNQYYQQRYDGKLLLVLDDTVGSDVKRVETEFFDLILGDIELAGVRTDAVYYKSDRIPLFYPWARRVIEKHGAYVCRCSLEVLRSNRAAGIPCEHRTQTIEQTLDEWDRMLANAYGPGEAVLRLRTDLADPDPAFRDRVLFRISDFDHPRVGRRWSVWPLLEFSWAVDDVELGVTHVVRGKDLVMEDRMERYLWDLLGVRGPPFLHWGILRVREAKVSKSKSYAEVKSGQYDGWADPRTWSLRSLDRRGIAMSSVRDFTLSFGLSLADIEVPAETLYAENRKRIDATTIRRMYVPDPVRVEVAEYPDGLATTELANHPERAELGRRTVPAGPDFFVPRRDIERCLGGEVRLKDLLNVELAVGPIPPSGRIHARFTSRENRKLPRLQWVGVDGAVPVEILGTDGTRSSGVGERSLAELHPRDILQFERVGFVRVEADWRPGSSPLRVVYGHP